MTETRSVNLYVSQEPETFGHSMEASSKMGIAAPFGIITPFVEPKLDGGPLYTHPQKAGLIK
jgi:hypothetical protein